jgi:methyl-accepting chemotaxis protein
VAAAAGASIGGLSDSVSASAQAARQVLAATQQQMAGTEQIALAMRNIQQSSSQSVAGTRQIERAAHDLTVEARRLLSLVGRDGAAEAERAR